MESELGFEMPSLWKMFYWAFYLGQVLMGIWLKKELMVTQVFKHNPSDYRLAMCVKQNYILL